jgi:hypothetical protein
MHRDSHHGWQECPSWRDMLFVLCLQSEQLGDWYPIILIALYNLADLIGKTTVSQLYGVSVQVSK